MTSLAVWGAPSPVVVDRPFSVSVGATCEMACPLEGAVVAVHDEQGARVGEARLGPTPRPGTQALYVAEVTVDAPTREGTYAWSVVMSALASEPGHAPATTSFSVRVAPPPEHRVTVAARDRDTGEALEDVQLRLGAYAAVTDARGEAILDVPGGTYDLYLRRPDYESHTETVVVTDGVTIRVSAVRATDDDADGEQVWM